MLKVRITEQMFNKTAYTTFNLIGSQALIIYQIEDKYEKNFHITGRNFRYYLAKNLIDWNSFYVGEEPKENEIIVPDLKWDRAPYYISNK